MVTKIIFEDKKQKRTVWVNGKAVRFKNGVAVVKNDEDAEEFVKKEGFSIIKEEEAKPNVEEAKPNEKKKKPKGKK